MFFNKKKVNKNENFEPLSLDHLIFYFHCMVCTMKTSFEIPSCLLFFSKKALQNMWCNEDASFKNPKMFQNLLAENKQGKRKKISSKICLQRTIVQLLVPRNSNGLSLNFKTFKKRKDRYVKLYLIEEIDFFCQYARPEYFS